MKDNRMDNIVDCAYNMDNGYVEVWFTDGNMLRMAERELYTKSKTAPSEEEREKARQEYLDRRGIQADFRW